MALGIHLIQNPKMCSFFLEALLKRVSQGREFNPINPLVDIYNSVLLSYAVPCGEEDLAKIVGDFLEEHEGMNPSSTRV